MSPAKLNKLLTAGFILPVVLAFVYGYFLPDNSFEEARALETELSGRADQLSFSLLHYENTKRKDHRRLLNIFADLDSLNQTFEKTDRQFGTDFIGKTKKFGLDVRRFAGNNDSLIRQKLSDELFSANSPPSLCVLELRQIINQKAEENRQARLVLNVLGVAIFGLIIFLFWVLRSKGKLLAPGPEVPLLQSDKTGKIFRVNDKMRTVLKNNFHFKSIDNQQIDTLFDYYFRLEEKIENADGKIFSAEAGNCRLHFYPRGGKAFMVTAQTDLTYIAPPVRSRYFQKIIDQNVGLFELEINGSFRSANLLFRKQTGFSENELREQSWSFFRPEEDEAADFPLLLEVRRNKKRVYEHRMRTASGSALWARTVFSPVMDSENQELIGFAGLMTDISPEKENEKLFLEGRGKMAAGMNELSRTNKTISRTFSISQEIFRLTASSDQNINVLINNALELGVSLTETKIGILSRIENQVYTVTHFHAPADSSLKKNTEFELKNTYCEITFRESRPIAIHEMSESEYKTHPCFQHFGLESYIGIPVRVHGKTYGTLNFSSSESRQPFDNAERDQLMILAQWLGSLLGRDVYESQLREANLKIETDYKQLKRANTRLRITQKEIEKNHTDIQHQTDALDQLAVVLFSNAQGLLVRANRYFYELTGFSEKDIIGKSFRRIFPDEDVKTNFTIRKGGRSMSAFLWKKNGEKLFLNFNMIRTKDKHGNFAGAYYLGTDLTDLRRAQDLLEAATSRQKAVFEAIPDQIYLLDKAGESQKESRKVLPKAIEKKLNAYFAGPESRQLIDSLQSETEADARMPLFRAEGRFFELRYIRLNDNFVLVFARDVTKSELQKSKIKKTEERLVLTAAAAGIGIWEWNKRSRKIEAEEVMCALFELEFDEKNSPRKFLAKIEPSDRAKLFEHLRNMTADRAVEVDFKLTGSQEIYLSLYVRLLTDSFGRPVRMIGTCRDITNRAVLVNRLQDINNELSATTEELRAADEIRQATSKRLEESLTSEHAAYEELKNTQSKLVQSEKMSVVGQLTAGIAHEINNAMNLVSGGMEVIRRDFDDLNEVWEALAAEIRYNGQMSEEDFARLERKFEVGTLYSEVGQMLESMTEGSNRAKRIVGELRTFSRRDEGQFKTVNLNEGIEATIRLLSKDWRQRVRVNFRPDPALPKVDCQPGKINQVFLNLMVNGIQSIEGQGVLELSTEYLANSQTAVFRIKDNGAGIPEEVRSKIFDPFFTTKPVGEGTGLGLSIVYEIIREHKGEIRFETEIDQGTLFEIKLPVGGLLDKN